MAGTSDKKKEDKGSKISTIVDQQTEKTIICKRVKFAYMLVVHKVFLHCVVSLMLSVK